jgi:hypothetical protein
MTLDESIEKSNALANSLQSIYEDIKGACSVGDRVSMDDGEIEKLGFDAQSLAEFLEKLKVIVDNFETKYKEAVNNE